MLASRISSSRARCLGSLAPRWSSNSSQRLNLEAFKASTDLPSLSHLNKYKLRSLSRAFSKNSSSSSSSSLSSFPKHFSHLSSSNFHLSSSNSQISNNFQQSLSASSNSSLSSNSRLNISSNSRLNHRSHSSSPSNQQV